MPHFVSFQHDLSGVKLCLNAQTVAFSCSGLPHRHSDALLLANATGDIDPVLWFPACCPVDLIGTCLHAILV